MGSFEEAIHLLTPHFTHLPQAYAPLMRWILSSYLQAAESAGVDPDFVLLAPVIVVFKRLHSPQ